MQKELSCTWSFFLAQENLFTLSIKSSYFITKYHLYYNKIIHEKTSEMGMSSLPLYFCHMQKWSKIGNKYRTKFSKINNASSCEWDIVWIHSCDNFAYFHTDNENIIVLDHHTILHIMELIFHIKLFRVIVIELCKNKNKELKSFVL